MVQHIKLQQIPHHVFNVLNPWVTKLQHLATIHTNQVIVLLEAVRLFVLRKVFAELVFFYQITTHQQFQGIVHRGTAYPVVLVGHVDV